MTEIIESISGWAMQHAAYLFLDRIWEKDQQTMKNISGYYKSCQNPLSVRMKIDFSSIRFFKEISVSLLDFYSLNRNTKRICLI